MGRHRPGGMRQAVAPFTGAWIEIDHRYHSYLVTKSLPSRERGLKYSFDIDFIRNSQVAPFTGAWIEIYLSTIMQRYKDVAPFTGAWIEI